MLAKEGFKKGVHHWEVVVHSIGSESQLGISLKSPENLDGLLWHQTTEFCVIGKQSHATQRYKPGDHVSFTFGL